LVKKLNENDKETLKNEVGIFIPGKKLIAWDDDIKLQSIENALKVGVILPKFRAYKNTVYTIKLIDKPKLVNSDKGNTFFTIDIIRDNMKFNLPMNNSFKFQLKVLLERNKTNLETLINRGVPLHISQDDSGYWSIQLL